MSRKPKPPIAHPRRVTPADSFVSATREKAAETPATPMKRITITVSEGLHHKIKRSCVDRRINMADAIREALENTPWPVAEAA